MPKIIPFKEVYDDLAAKGFYEEANLDLNEIRKVIDMAWDDYLFAKRMKNDRHASWRVIFNAYYDSFRELCDQLMRFQRQKTNNHQAVFAFVSIYYKELEFDWEILERIRSLGMIINTEEWM